MGVSITFDADAKAGCSSNIKDVKDWITACDTAFVIPKTIIELVTMDGTVRMGGHDVIVVVIKDDDVAAVVVGLDVEVEATFAVCKSLTGPRGLELRAVLVGREGEGIFLWETKTETKQNRQQAKQGQARSIGVALRAQIKNNAAHTNTDKQHINSLVAWQTITMQYRGRKLSIVL